MERAIAVSREENDVLGEAAAQSALSTTYLSIGTSAALELADAAGTLGDWLTGLLAAARLKTSLHGCGIDAPDITALATAAAGQWTGSFNPRAVAAADLAALYEAAR